MQIMMESELQDKNYDCGAFVLNKARLILRNEPLNRCLPFVMPLYRTHVANVIHMNRVVESCQRPVDDSAVLAYS